MLTLLAQGPRFENQNSKWSDQMTDGGLVALQIILLYFTSYMGALCCW